MIDLDPVRINWAELRSQKSTLVDLANELSETGRRPEAWKLDGLVAFLDYVQDQAALFVGEANVFGNLDASECGGSEGATT